MSNSENKTDKFTQNTMIQIAFDIVYGTVHQQVKVTNASYNEEKIIDGLKNGTLATTTWFERGGIQTIDVIETGERVAEILSQEVDAEYENFH